MAIISRLVENTKIFLSNRKTAYCLVFKNPDKKYSGACQLVLEDLKKFCRANASTFDTNDRMAAYLEGRRSVFVRIAQHLNMTPETLYEIYNAMPVQTQPQKDEIND